MRIYIETGPDSREYLSSVARTRPELVNEQRGMYVEFNAKLHHVNEVKAEATQLVWDTGLIVAGMGAAGVLIGFLFVHIFPFLAVVLTLCGPILGISLALKHQEKEERRALIFNSSQIHYEPGIELAQAA